MHSIRLRRPWKRIRGESPAVRIDVPDLEPMEDEPGEFTRYSRSFHRPTGLDDGSRVILCIDSWAGRLSSLTLNDNALPLAEAPLRVDITPLLATHNKLGLRVDDDGESRGQLAGNVTLMIEPA